MEVYKNIRICFNEMEKIVKFKTLEGARVCLNRWSIRYNVKLMIR